MITFCSITTTFLVCTTLYCRNPVKMSVIILLTSFTSFYTMSNSSGSSWFPMIFLLLFTGGILVMFMIISALMPNEKNPANKIMAFLMMAGLATWISSLEPFSSDLTSKMTMFLSSSSNFMTVTALILLYFLSFVQVLKKEGSPLRSTTCRWKSDFVSH